MNTLNFIESASLAVIVFLALNCAGPIPKPEAPSDAGKQASGNTYEAAQAATSALYHSAVKSKSDTHSNDPKSADNSERKWIKGKCAVRYQKEEVMPSPQGCQGIGLILVAKDGSEKRRIFPNSKGEFILILPIEDGDTLKSGNSQRWTLRLTSDLSLAKQEEVNAVLEPASQK